MQELPDNDGKARVGATKSQGKKRQLNAIIRKLRVHASISCGTTCSLHLGHKDRYGIETGPIDAQPLSTHTTLKRVGTRGLPAPSRLALAVAAVGQLAACPIGVCPTLARALPCLRTTWRREGTRRVLVSADGSM